MVNSFSLSIKPNAMVTGSFNLLAKEVVAMTSTPLDAAPTIHRLSFPMMVFLAPLRKAVLLSGWSLVWIFRCRTT
jgi:hypothetical protein